jgi:replicative DNA helicase
MLRKIAKLGDEYARRACDLGESAVELIAEFDQRVLAIATDTRASSYDLLAQSDRAMTHLKQIRRGELEAGYPLGIPKLDQQIGGLGRSVLTVVGGRPQMGKSCLVAHAILNNCPSGIPVHVFSIEMAAEALLERLWAAVSGVEYHRVHHPKRMNDVQLGYVEKAMLEVASWPLVIDDASGITAAQLISRARVIKRKKGTQILAIDYLQKLQFKSEMRHRHQDITDACVALASFAKTEKVATMLLSSITEGSDKNRNMPPTLQHLRGSGDIAFEAHTVLLIHRKVDPESEAVNLEGELIIAKGRSDAIGLLPVTFHPASLTFK